MWDHNEERSIAIKGCTLAHEKKKNAITGRLVNLPTRWRWQWYGKDVDNGNYHDYTALGKVCHWIFTIKGGTIRILFYRQGN